MNRWIVLPYDGSPLAIATLRRAAHYVAKEDARKGGIMLAVAGGDGARLQSLLDEARAVAGPSATLDARLLPAGDPAAGLCRLADTLGDAALAVPILHRSAQHDEAMPWFTQAVRYALQASPWFTVAFFITEKELRQPRRTTHERPGLGRAVGALLRHRPRVRVGVRTPVKGGAH